MTTLSDRKPSAAEQATLFDLPPANLPVPAATAGVGRPRLRQANRDQIVDRALPLNALLPADHAARTIWAYVQGLDLSTLHDAIGSVRGGSGHAATDPRVLLALWLYATSDGVGSARRLDRLCRDHVAYQWIAGGVTMNYHTLADFRTDHVELLDGLLTRSIATLMAEGLIDLNRVARDGMRVRASAGAASSRRRPTPDEASAQAEAQVEALRAEAEGDPAAADRRRKAARERAARDQAGRIKSALARLPELEAKKVAHEKDKARCSTTDPEATVMKTADGGFRPAYHAQFATTVDGLAVVGVDVIASGSDAGQMAPMVEQVRDRSGVTPSEMPADGGFAQHDQIDAVSAPGVGCTVYAPVPRPRDPKMDRYVPKPDDSPAVAARRARMATAEAKEIYKGRAATAECVNALARGRGLLRFVVRGLARVRAVALWHAVTRNVMRMATPRAASAAKA